MSIVEFAEEILGYKLLSFQKEFLTKCYEAYASNKQLYFIPHRGYNIKWMAFVLQYIVIAYHEKYSGENVGMSKSRFAEHFIFLERRD